MTDQKLKYSNELQSKSLEVLSADMKKLLVEDRMENKMENRTFRKLSYIAHSITAMSAVGGAGSLIYDNWHERSQRKAELLNDMKCP